MATTSSGLTLLFGSFPKKFLTVSIILGILVIPPTSTTSLISAEEKKAIEDGIEDLKKSLEGADIEDTKKKTQNLIQVSMKLGEAVYKSQQKPEADKAKGENNKKPNDKENVVDADFEDVKEEDKEKSA